jgi:putative ABC transport system permease protein
MGWMNRLRNLGRGPALTREIDEEIAAHLAMRTEDNRAAGMSKEAAKRDARVRFGNAIVMRERAAEADTAVGLERIWADLRFALRQLRKSPGFAVTVILILSLGIGSCTVIFSALKPVLIDPLPYSKARDLMMIWEQAKNGAPISVAFGTYRGLEAHNHSFEAMAVMKPWQPSVSAGSETERPERLEGQRVSAEFFRTLGIAPRLGRDFDADDDRVRGPAVAILSDGLWRRRFAADPAIVGRQVRLDDTLYTIVGVMPASFEDVLEPEAEVWAPLQYDSSLPVDGREWGHHLRMIGRLRPGVTQVQAREEADTLLTQQGRIYAKGYENTGGVPNGLSIEALQKDLTRAVRPALMAVAGATGLILLIICVNVTNLLLARNGQRRAEFAMRTALGASRGRLVRQLLTEGLLLALFGGVLGLGIAMMGVRLLTIFTPPDLPRAQAIGVDGGVFLFALGVTVLTGLVAGLAPVMQASRLDLNNSLRGSSRTAAVGEHWTRSALIVGEVSLAVVLLVGAGLLLRSMQRLLAIDPGFEGSHLLTMQVQENGHRYDNAVAGARFYKEAAERVRQLPGVISAGFTSQLPLSGDSEVYGVEFDGRHDFDGPALRYAVTPGYMEAMHIPLLSGRLLDERDTASAPVAILISEAFARRVYGGDTGQAALNKRVRVGPDAGHADRPWATIVGVVGNVKQESLAVGEEDAFYIATAQWPWAEHAESLVVRTKGEPAAMASAVRDAVWSVDRNQPIVRVATMDHLLRETEAKRYFVLMLFEVFALAALILAATGIYGIVSGSVTERMRELGIRAALGASRKSLLRLVLRHGLGLAAVGVAVGLGGALAASRAIAALLFGVTQYDPLTYCAISALLLGVAGIACLVPARRAALVDPMQALRAE